MFLYIARNEKLFGLFAVMVGILTWVSDLAGLVYACPYCRVERSVILLLGVLILAKGWRSGFVVFCANILAFFGSVVAVNQNFMGWSSLFKGEFQPLLRVPYENAFLLSFGALVMIFTQMLLVNTRFWKSNGL